MNNDATLVPRVIGFDSHPDTFTAALLRGPTPAAAVTEKMFNKVPMSQLQSWAKKHTSAQDLFVLEASGNSFQVVRSRDQAELLFVLSSKIESEGIANPTVDRRFGPDLSFHFRYRPANAYLTVDDAVTGERLWSGSHAWGGLLTGFNSAGRRLVHRLRKQVER